MLVKYASVVNPIVMQPLIYFEAVATFLSQACLVTMQSLAWNQIFVYAFTIDQLDLVHEPHSNEISKDANNDY